METLLQNVARNPDSSASAGNCGDHVGPNETPRGEISMTREKSGDQSSGERSLTSLAAEPERNAVGGSEGQRSVNAAPRIGDHGDHGEHGEHDGGQSEQSCARTGGSPAGFLARSSARAPPANQNSSATVSPPPPPPPPPLPVNSEKPEANIGAVKEEVPKTAVDDSNGVATMTLQKSQGRPAHKADDERGSSSHSGPHGEPCSTSCAADSARVGGDGITSAARWRDHRTQEVSGQRGCSHTGATGEPGTTSCAADSERAGEQRSAASSERTLEQRSAAGSELTLEQRSAAGSERAIEQCSAAGSERTLEQRSAAGSELTLEQRSAAGNERTLEQRSAAGSEVVKCITPTTQNDYQLPGERSDGISAIAREHSSEHTCNRYSTANALPREYSGNAAAADSYSAAAANSPPNVNKNKRDSSPNGREHNAARSDKRDSHTPHPYGPALGEDQGSGDSSDVNGSPPNRREEDGENSARFTAAARQRSEHDEAATSVDRNPRSAAESSVHIAEDSVAYHVHSGVRDAGEHTGLPCAGAGEHSGAGRSAHETEPNSRPKTELSATAKQKNRGVARSSNEPVLTLYRRHTDDLPAFVYNGPNSESSDPKTQPYADSDLAPGTGSQLYDEHRTEGGAAGGTELKAVYSERDGEADREVYRERKGRSGTHHGAHWYRKEDGSHVSLTGIQVTVARPQKQKVGSMHIYCSVYCCCCWWWWWWWW